MKLLNQSISLISISLLAIIGLWGVIFYINMIGEIKESVDEGLDNYRRQIVYQAHQDTALLKQVDFNEGFYAIQEITQEEAQSMLDFYSDTSMYIYKGLGKSELEPFRVLTTAFKDDGRFYKLRVINSMVERDDLISQTFRNVIILYFLLIISIIIINNLALRQVWAPFYKFLEQLKSYRLGHSNSIPRIKTNTTEFIDLQEATETLLQHGTAAFEQQKQFIGNAAHELQTPLAITLNRLELLLEQGSLSGEQAEDISEAINLIERMIRQNKSLLLLTKIENRQFADNQIVSINKEVLEAVEEFSEIATFKGIGFRVLEKGNLTVEMDPSLAAILINNLLRNAVFHNSGKKDVEVIITSTALEIINYGENSLDEKSIFNRFQKSESKNGGSGLGLPIVKAISDLYKLRLTYTFLENSMHSFKIRFHD